MQKFYFYSLCIMNPFVVFCVVQIKTLLRIIFWNSSLEFLVFIITILEPQPLNIFILKNLKSMSNELFSRVLGSKFGMGYLKFLKKDRKKLLKDHYKQRYSISFKLDTPMLMLIRLLWKWKSNSLVLYFHLILFFKISL